MRVVIDVNVWVSGLLWGGVPGKLLRLAQTQRIGSYVSAELLLELEMTLKRDKFQGRLQQRKQTVETLVEVATAISVMVPIGDVTVPALRDPADSKILATVIAAQAAHLVTGDQDLLVLQTFEGAEILTPSQLLQRYFQDVGG